MGDPVPDNLAAMEAAFKAGDVDAIYRESKTYQRQLNESGSTTPMNACPPPYAHSYYAGECLFCGKEQY